MSASRQRACPTALLVSVLIGCYGGGEPFDFSCTAIDSGIIDASYVAAEANGERTIVRVFGTQETARSAGSVACLGKAEWSDGQITPLAMQAVQLENSDIQYRYQVVADDVDAQPSVSRDEESSEPVLSGTPGGGGATGTIDPSMATCEGIRSEVVRMSERDRINRGFALLKIYEPRMLSRSDDRLTCQGRALWTNGSSADVEYGFYRDSEGDYLLTYRNLELEHPGEQGAAPR